MSETVGELHRSLKKRKIVDRRAWFYTLEVENSYHQKKNVVHEKGVDM